MTETRCAVLVFARAPRPGHCKTRLIPALGAAGAARASAALTRRALRAATAADVGPVELWCAPDAHHPFFGECRQHCEGLSLHAQCDGDIGLRMHHAFADALTRHPRAVLIGADAVSLGAGDIRAAARALDSHDAAFVPAEDGGYLLVALNRANDALFDGITWGSPAVWAQTRARLDAMTLNARVLPAGYDVDHPPDWARAVREGLIEALTP
jgi:uncharacterized protein